MSIKSRLNTAIGALLLVCAPLAVAAQEAPGFAGLDQAGRAELAAKIEAAKKEGMLNYADTIIQPTTNDVLVKAFRSYYALPDSFVIKYTLLTSGAMVTRLEQELSANRVTYDVAALGSPTWTFERRGKGVFMNYRSRQYDAYTQAIELGLGAEGEFILNGGYAQIPIWNTAFIDFKGKSYRDALAAAPAGRFSIGNVAQSESHLTTYTGLRQTLDIDFFKEMAKKKPTFVGRSELSAQRILTGQDLFAFGGNPSRVHQNNKKGAKLRILYPSEGFTFLPQMTFILAKAPHPNAAKLWIDFILSEAGQKILVDREALISGRNNFKSPIPDVAPGLADLKIIKIDWSTISSEMLKKYREEWVGIFNP